MEESYLSRPLDIRVHRLEQKIKVLENRISYLENNLNPRFGEIPFPKPISYDPLLPTKTEIYREPTPLFPTMTPEIPAPFKEEKLSFPTPPPDPPSIFQTGNIARTL